MDKESLVPEVLVITLREETIYTVQHCYEIIPKLLENAQEELVLDFWKQLQTDITAIQNTFKEHSFFIKNPQYLDELWFCPSVLAHRLLFGMQEMLFSSKPERDTVDYRVKLEFTVKIHQTQGFESFIGFVTEELTTPSLSSRCSQVRPYLIPKLSRGYKEISNQHRISDHWSFLFPIEQEALLGYFMDKEQVYQPDTLEPTQTMVAWKCRLMFKIQQIIEHYLDYADHAMAPTLYTQYKHWVKTYQIPIVMCEDDFWKKWPYHRNRLEDLLQSQFERIRKENSQELTFNPRGYLGVVLHPPDMSNLEVDPFLVMEFVEIDWPIPTQRPVAKTLEMSGSIFEPNSMTSNIISSNMLH